MPFAFTLNGLCISFLSLSGEEVKAKTRKTADARATRARWGFSQTKRAAGDTAVNSVAAPTDFRGNEWQGSTKRGHPVFGVMWF